MSNPLEFSTYSPSTRAAPFTDQPDAHVRLETTENVPLDFDFSVNPNNLEMEWRNLPLAVFNASKLLANARYCQDDVKRRLSVTRTDTDIDIRRFPKKYELEKITEATVASFVNSNAAVQEMESLVNKSKHNVDMAFAVVSAMSAKKDALNAITELKKMNYYTTR